MGQQAAQQTSWAVQPYNTNNNYSSYSSYSRPDTSRQGPPMAREEEMQRRQVELKRKRHEEDERRREQSASLVVRKVIQRVKLAEPQNFGELKAELEGVQQEQLDRMGQQ